MDWLSAISLRLARWAAYSDYCMNAEFGLPHCRAFWTWAGILTVLAVLGITVYVVRQVARGREPACLHDDGSNNAE